MKDLKVIEPIAVRTFPEADQALLALADCEQHLQKAEAEMNQQIQEIRDAYEKNTLIVRNAKAALEAELERFCIANKNEFEKQRSKELTHGILGFRNTPPKVMLLNRKYKWETVLELLQRVRFGKDLIRTKEEVNKEQVLAVYASKEVDDQKLASVGLKIDQSEEFFCKIKWENLPDEALS